MTDKIKIKTIIPQELEGERLDKALAILFPDYSRARLQSWIKLGEVLVNNKKIKQRDCVAAGDLIQIDAIQTEQAGDLPENIPLDIVYTDEQIILLNKPAGLVVHPGAGNRDHTLVNALLNFDAKLAQLPRAGIVHRLDKDTSGIMVIARTLKSHAGLVKQIQDKKVKRIYEAIVCGELTSGGRIDQPIARHPVNRTKMAIVANGKPAVTHYRILNKFKGYTHIQVNLETGRTHQIRVHMTSIRHPLVGDPQYGNRIQLAKGISEHLRTQLQSFERQALHARALELFHPVSQEYLRWETPLPDDMQRLLGELAHESNK